MRLQQFLARSGITSRRKAEDLIRAGRVAVNGHTAEIGTVVQESDSVTLDGERVRLPHKTVVILLHKPKGYTTTHEDEHAEKLVYELVPEHPGLHSVGRLDKDTEGLLLLTNDGNLTQMLTHPRNEVPKLYRAWSKRGKLSEEDCRKLVEGVMLGDGLARALEARPAKDGVKLVLAEGRKREVRRMLGKIKHPVERLVRLAVGPVELGELEAGDWRYLSAEEIEFLRNSLKPGRKRKWAMLGERSKKVDEPRKAAKPSSSRAKPEPRGGKPAFSDKSRPQGSKAKTSKPHKPAANASKSDKTRISDSRARQGDVKSSDERIHGGKRQGADQRGPNRKPNPRNRRPNPN